MNGRVCKPRSLQLSLVRSAILHSLLFFVASFSFSFRQFSISGKSCCFSFYRDDNFSLLTCTQVVNIHILRPPVDKLYFFFYFQRVERANKQFTASDQFEFKQYLFWTAAHNNCFQIQFNPNWLVPVPRSHSCGYMCNRFSQNTINSHEKSKI